MAPRRSPRKLAGNAAAPADVKNVKTATKAPKKASSNSEKGKVSTKAPSSRAVTKQEKSASESIDTKASKATSAKLPKSQTSSKTSTSPKKRKASAKAEDSDQSDEEDAPTAAKAAIKAPPAAKKRKTTQADKDAAAMPLAARTAVGSLKRAMYIGAHVSASGGVQNAVTNASHIGANAFALFLKSQRKWVSPPLADAARDAFVAGCAGSGSGSGTDAGAGADAPTSTSTSASLLYDTARHVLPHGSYLVNLAQADTAKAEQAYACFLDDLQRCEALGIALYNFHPGSTGGLPREAALGRIAAMLNRAHRATRGVVTLLENMAGAGHVVGGAWEDLRDIIARVEDKARVGVCLDTCHAFAAGHDLRGGAAFAATMRRLDAVVGLRHVRALHLNDSKAPLGARRDLHANIGTGFLGLRAFWNVVNYAPFEGLPMVLETPTERPGAGGKPVEDRAVWAAEIKLLESLVGMDPDSDEFRREEERLQALGAEERKKFQAQADGKKQKTLKEMLGKKETKKGRGGKRAARKKGGEDEDEEIGGSDSGCSHG